MTLADATHHLLDLDPAHTIYAARPWSPASVAFVAFEPDEGGVPSDAQTRGCEYFLEVSIAAEFLDGWRTALGREPTLVEACTRLIQYATNDA